MNRLNTKRLLSGYFFYECGRAMYFVLITWFLYQWTGDALYTGLFVSFGFIPGLFSNLIFGVLVDRKNRKRLASIAGLCSIICLVFLWGAFFIDWIHPLVMIVSHMVLQTLGSLFRPSLQALVAEVFPKEDLPRIFTWSASSTVAGSLCGASLGGILAGWLTVTSSLVVVVCLYLGAWVTVELISYTPIPKQELTEPTSFIKEMKDGFTYVHTHQMLYGLFIMMMLGQLTFHTTLGFLSVYTSAHLQQSSIIYGFLDSTFSIGGIVAGLIGTWWWMKCKDRLAVWSLLIMAAGLALVGLTSHVWVAFLGFAMIGLGTSFVRALLQSIQQMATDPHFHGRMSSLRMLGNQTSVVITGPIFGIVATSQGAYMVFLLLLFPVLLGVLWAIKQSKHPAFIEITSQQSA
ncbi:MFS transporter [Halobacillus litoralis]|uniref:MFS transporter n=1 Tax=Halobacillus litoralis TaxID=45668 RepID=UPI0024917977|nr:MFS transporter [Halobacillus litoralis]